MRPVGAVDGPAAATRPWRAVCRPPAIRSTPPRRLRRRASAGRRAATGTAASHRSSDRSCGPGRCTERWSAVRQRRPIGSRSGPLPTGRRCDAARPTSRPRRTGRAWRGSHHRAPTPHPPARRLRRRTAAGASACRRPTAGRSRSRRRPPRAGGQRARTVRCRSRHPGSVARRAAAGRPAQAASAATSRPRRSGRRRCGPGTAASSPRTRSESPARSHRRSCQSSLRRADRRRAVPRTSSGSLPADRLSLPVASAESSGCAGQAGSATGAPMRG